MQKVEPPRAVPKDEGWAWMILLGCFIVNFAIIGGCTWSFGILLPEISLRFNATATQVAWLPAIASFIRLFIATPANMLAAKIGTRWVVVTGSLLMNVGFFLGTFANRIEILYVTFGCIVGVGAGLCYAPSIVILGQYFDKRRCLANGISFCGAGIGSFVLPPIIRYSADSYGLNTTFLLLATVMLHVCIAGLLFRPPSFYLKKHTQSKFSFEKLPETVVWVTEIKPDLKICLSDSITMTASPVGVADAQEKTSNDDVSCVAGTKTTCNDCNVGDKASGFRWRLLCNPLMLMYALTLAICDSSYGNVYMLMPPHATSTGFSSTKGALLISVIGITQAVSRLIFGWFGDFNVIDKKYIYQGALLVCGTTFCVMPFIQNYVLLATVSVLCSLSAGSFVVLSAVLVAENLGTANLPTTYGILYSTESLFFLASPVLMGWLRDMSGRWNDSFLISGALLIFGACVYIFEPCAAKYGKKSPQKTKTGNTI